ncbi:MAG: hypothetical protein P4L87_23610 [Formivibrio sp.]|nr:hypothetical protein [Formivibrio sp.]
MWQFVQRLLGRSDAALPKVDPALIDRLVEIASPRIKLVSNYRQRLAPMVRHASSRVHLLEGKLSAPLPLTAETWRQNPLLNLAFANPERMAALVAASETVCQWFAAHPLADKAFAVLAMAHDVEHRYGMEEHEGRVRQDVLQDVLVLRDHRFGEPVGTLGEFALQARLRALEELAHHAARRMQGLEADRSLIENEINTLRVALRLGGSVDPLTASSMQRQRQKRLDFLQEELIQTRTALEPDSQLEILSAALRDPESQLRFTETELQVDALGILRSGDQTAHVVRLVEIEMIADIPVRRALLPVEIPRALIRRDDGGLKEPDIFNITAF